MSKNQKIVFVLLDRIDHLPYKAWPLGLAVGRGRLARERVVAALLDTSCLFPGLVFSLALHQSDHRREVGWLYPLRLLMESAALPVSFANHLLLGQAPPAASHAIAPYTHDLAQDNNVRSLVTFSSITTVVGVASPS